MKESTLNNIRYSCFIIAFTLYFSSLYLQYLNYNNNALYLSFALIGSVLLFFYCVGFILIDTDYIPVQKNIMWNNDKK